MENVLSRPRRRVESLEAVKVESWQRKVKLGLQKVGIYILLILTAGAFLFPFYWLLLNTFKRKEEIFGKPSFIVEDFTLVNYSRLVRETKFLLWYQNSVVIAIGFTFLALFFCSLAGYAFAKHEFPGKRMLFWILLVTVMIPGFITLIPLFIWFVKLGLMDTHWILIVPGSANAFGIFLMRQYIYGVPSEMIDSAKIDGCSEFRIYAQIVLPVVKPALGALTIFMFMQSWNNFMAPLIFMRSDDMFTVPVGLSSLVGEKNPEYGMLMAGSILSILPLVVVFFRMQRELVAGLTLGAVKG